MKNHIQPAAKRAGIKGINNAVARVTGVAAIAIFGTVMVSGFGSRLNHRLENMPLPLEIVRDVRANETNWPDNNFRPVSILH